MNKLFTTVLLSVLLFFLVPNLYAQSYDYPPYPQMDVTYEHLQGELEMNQEGEIRGDVSFDIRFNVESSDSIMLHAVRMLVEDVLLDERTMDFEIHNDTLIVYLDETFSRAQTANLRVVYSTTPVFGVLRTNRGTSFTSQLPLSTRHWLPVADYPSTLFTYDLTVRHPAAKSLVMGGSLVSNEVVSVDTEATRYRTDTEMPVSALFFALSDFETSSRLNSSRNIFLHVEQPNEIELDPDRLLNSADETIRRMEDLTGKSYPFSDLHLVALHDLVWEHRTFAAGAVLIDVNESIEDQIAYGIMSQWAGVQLREMQWSDSDALQLMQGYFSDQLNLSGSVRDSLLPWNSLYKKVSAENIDRYQYYLSDNDQMARYLSASKESLFDEARFPLTWQDFSRVIYRETGRTISGKPEFLEPVIEKQELYEYRVKMEINDTENEARLQFAAIDEAVEELVSVRAEQFAFNDSDSRELTFTGANDEIVLSIQSTIENIELTVLNRTDVNLTVEKPFMFWIYQLQNSENASKRVEAAIGLRQYDDNPDLQLAILDMIRNESSEEVIAEILETLRMVTSGASGTAQLFLDRIGEDQSFEIRLTAIRALGVYENNDRVISTLQSVIQSANREELKVAAIQSLAKITESERLGTITESLVTRETVLHQVPTLLRALVEKGEAEKAVQLSDTFLSSEFPYDVRVGALSVILGSDQSQSGWVNRIEQLLTDGDPRIRYRAVEGIQYLNESERSRIIETRLIEEHDERVASALRNI